MTRSPARVAPRLLTKAEAAIEDVLAEFERRTKAVPVGHENPSRGSSTYNWRICHLDELREIALELAAKEGT